MAKLNTIEPYPRLLSRKPAKRSWFEKEEPRSGQDKNQSEDWFLLRERIALRRGAGNVTRTHDLLITNQLLYRLSYTSIFRLPKYYNSITPKKQDRNSKKSRSFFMQRFPYPTIKSCNVRNS